VNTTSFNAKILLRITLIASILVAVAGFLTDFNNTRKYGGIDLRDRVVGARVASELNRDPYFFKWTSDLSDRFLDPLDNRAIPLYTRLTVTPAVLSLHSLFSEIPYKAQRYFWFFIQWVSLLGSIYLLAKILSDNSDNRALIWILGLLGISGSMFWRLHSERGQIYILYIFLFSFSFYLYDKYQKKNNNRRFNSLFVASALIFGYLISLRPTFIFAIIPFLIYKKFKFASIIIAGMAASVLISSLLSPAPLWKSYSRSIQLQTLLFSDETINYQPYDQNIADGLNLKNSLSVPGEDSSLFRIFRAVFNQWFSSQTLFILLLGFLIIISLIIYKYKIPEISSRQLFFLAIALSFFSEFFIAAPRWPYANVIWLIPLSIMIAEAKKIAVSRLVILADVIVFLGLIANLGFHLIPRFTFIGDVGIPTATLLFLIAMLRRVSTKKDVFAVQ